MLLEIKVQLEDASIEAGLEPMSFRHLPLTIDYGEGDVFIGSPTRESNC